MKNYQDAVDLATRLFDGVYDKGGKPYIGHCLRVAEGLPADVSEEARMAGVLHDVIEDTGTTAQDLLDMGYPPRTVELVQLMSRPEGVTYLDWIRSIRETNDYELIQLKLSDNRDNDDPVRIAQLPLDARGITKRYSRAREILLS